MLEEGLEPPPLSGPDPKSGASANFAIRARCKASPWRRYRSSLFRPLWCQHGKNFLQVNAHDLGCGIADSVGKDESEALEQGSAGVDDMENIPPAFVLFGS